MKSLSGGLAAHYATRSTSLAYCLRLQREDDEVFRFTSADVDITVDGETYRAGPGLDISTLVQSAGLAPDNLELRILYADDAITRADLLAGRWDNARWRLFKVNARNPVDGIDFQGSGRCGEAKINRQSGFTIELRSLKQALQRSCGAITQKTCRYEVGDSRCGKNMAAFTFLNVPVTAVASPRVFTASSRAEAAEYFQAGSVTFVDGLNAGITREVKTFSAGVFELLAPFPFVIEVGDLFDCVAGCQRRLEDCRFKFNNVLNFGGEPHLVGTDSLTAQPERGS